MPVAAAEPLQKSTPDVGKLSGMTNRIVQVTKHMSRTGPGQAVVPATQNVSVDWIIDLQNSLPRTHGPGTYRFEVNEMGGTDKDVWIVRLGPEENNTMGTVASGFPTVAGASPLGDADGLQMLGPGYFFNPTLGTLVTPWKAVFAWQPGQPLPTPPGQGATTTTFGAPFTQIPGVPGWGTFPAVGGDDQRMRQLEDKLAESERQRENDRRTAEQERRERELRDLIQRSQEETNRRIEALLARLTEKPSGPSEVELRLQREVEETRRAQADQAREERIRSEMRANQEQMQALLREVAGSKNDPVMAMIGQLMQVAQASQTETVRAVTGSTQAQLSAAERNIMSPLQIMELIRASKDNTAAGEMNKAQVEMFKTVFGMAQDLLRIQGEIQGQGEMPPWVGLAQQGLERIGAVAQVYMQSKQQAPAVQGEYTAPPRPAQQQRPQQRRQAPPPAAVATPPAAPAVPAREPTAAEMRDAAARQVFKTAPAPAPQVAAAAPAAPAAPVVPEVVPTGRRRKRGQAPAPTPAPAAAAAPTLADATADEVRMIVAGFDDAKFFGSALMQIANLRAAVEKEDLKPPQCAGAVLMSRQYFMAFGELPPAIELLNHGHFEVLVERLLPQVTEQFRADVVASIRAQLQQEDASAAGETEDDDEDTDEDSGEEAA